VRDLAVPAGLPRPQCIAVVFAAAGALFACVAAAAQPRDVQVAVTGGVEAQRNGRLRPDAGPPDAGVRVGIDVAVAAVGAPGIVVLRPADVTSGLAPPGTDAGAEPTGGSWRLEASGVRYGDAADLDADRFALAWGRRFDGEVRGGGLLLSASDRDAETSVAGFAGGEAVRDDDQRRREYAAQGDLRFDASENLSLAVDVAALRTRFHDGLLRTQADYDVQAVSLRAAFAIDEYSEGAVTVGRDRFESAFAGSRRREDTWGLRVDHAWALAESTRLRLSAGVRRTTTVARGTFGPVRLRAEQQDDGVLGEVSLRHAWSSGDVECSLARTRQPSGIGVQFERDAVSLLVRVPLDDTRSATLQANADRNRAGGDAAPEERLWSVRAGLGWQLRPQLAVDLQAGFRAQRVGAAGAGRQRADGALVRLEFRYTTAAVL
jgi:hypothetical protein